MKLSRSILSLALTTLTACAGTYSNTVSFNPSEPIRIAVLPFAQVGDDGKLVRTDASLALFDDISLISSKLKQTPAQFVQNIVQSELSKASLDVVTPAVVDADLVHAGFGKPGSQPIELDLDKVFNADPNMLCTKLLACDAVLYGKVTRWNRSYYGIQSVAAVAIDLKLVSAKTKKVLFEAKGEDSESRGLTKGPTGLSDIVLEPIKGLDNDIILNLSRKVVAQTIAPLRRENRPEFLSSAPPAILAAAHDARSGVIPSGGRLIVMALGTGGHSGSFSIGSYAAIPMVERSPGQYIGEFIPLPSDSFEGLPVTVSLKDSVGRSVEFSLTKTPVSVGRNVGG